MSTSQTVIGVEALAQLRRDALAGDLFAEALTRMDPEVQRAIEAEIAGVEEALDW